ncbi:MAG: helix-turn-helix domain-containing protein [Cyanobium sp.]
MAAAIAGQEPQSQLVGAEAGPLPLRALTGQQCAFIFSLLRHIDACASVDPSLPLRLGLDDLILRQVACLLKPELVDAPDRQSNPCQDRRGRKAFDELLDFIRANLDQPLRLSELETRSFYSRRSLQYAFRDKLNTTPVRWIREQRLTRAMERLESEGPALSIEALALSCGYRQLSRFSADFKRRFGLTPSQAKRASLR